MRTPFKISTLLLLFLAACNFPAPGIPPLPGSTEPAPALPTNTGPDYNYSECGFVWAREPLPELSREFEAALKAALPQASGYAEAYGENCLNNSGEVVRFLAMETDFYFTFQVENLEDKQALGGLIEHALGVLAQFPVGETPGPQPGYVGIVFQAPGHEERLWFSQQDAQTALDNGLRGEGLYLALREK
jgi:hypothetical protein